ncbi:MAG TPA: DUF4383 domain-containing protein [Tepidisphaeraceae bacterium]|nr:DUF4383 domain-containing protein [Tepidisphaeraceae bacterium]
MAAKFVVFLTGLIYLFFGICGFIPSLVIMPPPRLRFYILPMIGHWGFLFNWLPVNIVHNIVYILIGCFALLASVTRPTAIKCAKGLFFVMFAFAVTGFLPFGFSHLWGFMPLFEWNVMLHIITAMLLYYYGFVYPLDWGGPEPEPAPDPPPPNPAM